MSHQLYRNFGQTSNGRLFINQELLPHLADKLPRENYRVLNVGVHKYWDYECLFNNPSRLGAYDTMDTHPGGGDQPAPTLNLNIQTCDSVPDNLYDLIIMIGVWESLDHQADALTHINRMLKPGGRALISTPGRSYYKEPERSLTPQEAVERLKPLRVDEIYLTYEKEAEPSAVHCVCSKQ